MQVRVVSFDLDDTLYPEADFVRGGLAAAGVVLDSILPRPAGAGRVLADVLAEHGPAGVFDRALDRLGVPRDPATLARLVDAFRAHLPVIAPFPGVEAMLSDLRRRGVALALVTDGYPDVQRRKWSALPLSPFFDAVVFTGDIAGLSAPKPDPTAFLFVERALRATGREVVCVGDNPAKDFPPADALGWTTVRVRYPGGYHSLDPDPMEASRPQARSVEELHRILIGML